MSVAAQFNEAKQTAVVFKMPGRVLVEFTGADRQRFLHNFCTNDINNLAVNSGCEAIFTNIKARALGHGFVFAGESSHWLETVGDGLDDLLKHLDKYLITDDVEITRRDELQQILVTGPMAVERVAVALQVTDPPAPLSQVAAGDLWVRRVDCLDQPGILIAGTETAIAAAIEELATAGASLGDAATYEALRLQAGFPHYGTDVTEDHLAPEVGRVKKTISYRKGCYLGQEPIARIDALGHVNKSLRPVEISGSEPPAAGSSLSSPDGENAGTTVSSVKDPSSDDRCFALAWIKSAHTAAGTELKLDDRTVTVRGE